MVPALEQRSIPAFDRMSPADVGAVVRNALVLQNLALSGGMQPLLRGKNLGLLTEAPAADPAAALFGDAARGLGAHVAHVHPELSDGSTPSQLRETAQLLGRLYDAIEVQGLAPAVVRQLQALCSVPVFDGIAMTDHAAFRIADQLGGEASIDDKRRFVVQAMLLGALA